MCRVTPGLGSGGGRVGPEGGSQHRASCIAGRHTRASLCPYRCPWEHPAHLPPPGQVRGTSAGALEKGSLVFVNLYKETGGF